MSGAAPLTGPAWADTRLMQGSGFLMTSLQIPDALKTRLRNQSRVYIPIQSPYIESILLEWAGRERDSELGSRCRVGGT